MKEYLESQLKMTITIEESQDNYQGLPLLYKTQYRIYTVSSNGVIWMALEPKKFLGLAKLRGNRAYLEKVKQMNCVLFLEDATFYSVEKMKEEGIPFVLKGKEVFLPFLGILFTKKFTNTNGVARTKLSYNAQMLLIKLLYLPRIKYSKADIAQRLQLNPVYVTRATKELLDMGLISEYKEGRSVFVERENSSEELFDSAKQLFVSPISKVIYVKKNKRLQEYPIASDYALSEISMINPSDVPVYACWKKDALVNDVKIIDEPSWNDSDDMVKLELWDYDPKKLSDGKTVDIVSLYCSLMNNNDPRIQGEMENILEDFEWQL